MTFLQHLVLGRRPLGGHGWIPAGICNRFFFQSRAEARFGLHGNMLYGRSIDERAPLPFAHNSSTRIQHTMDSFRIAGNDGEIGTRWLIGFAAPLLPITQGAERDVIARREFLLRKGKRAAKRLRPRYAARGTKLRRCHRARIGIFHRRRLDFLVRHRAQTRVVVLVWQHPRRAVAQNAHQNPVTPPFGYDSTRSAHVLSLFSQR